MTPSTGRNENSNEAVAERISPGSSAAFKDRTTRRTHVNWHSEVVQRGEALRLHHPRRGRTGSVRPPDRDRGRRGSASRRYEGRVRGRGRTEGAEGGQRQDRRLTRTGANCAGVSFLR